MPQLTTKNKICHIMLRCVLRQLPNFKMKRRQKGSILRSLNDRAVLPVIFQMLRFGLA